MANNTALTKHARIWARSAALTFARTTQSRLDFYMYVGGKLLRMGFFFVFAFSLFSNTQELGGYSKHAVLLFFATMNIIDILGQLLWRGIAIMPQMVRKGTIDALLVKPMSPLFYVATHLFDFWDLATLPAGIAFLAYAFHGLAFSATQMLLWFALLFFGLIAALAINILIAAVSFWTTQMENLYWLYRDLVYVARFPPTIFPPAIRFGLTFVVPILIITAFPTQALLGTLPLRMIAWAIVATVCLWILATTAWRAGLKRYTSASS